MLWIIEITTAVMVSTSTERRFSSANASRNASGCGELPLGGVHLKFGASIGDIEIAHG